MLLFRGGFRRLGIPDIIRSIVDNDRLIVLSVGNISEPANVLGGNVVLFKTLGRKYAVGSLGTGALPRRYGIDLRALRDDFV